MACASPRLFVWIGSAEAKTKAAELFYPQLAAIAMEKYGNPEPADNIAKLNAQFLALHDLSVTEKTTYNPALSVISLKDWSGLATFKALNFGNGLLLEHRLDTLDTLASYTRRRGSNACFFRF